MGSFENAYRRLNSEQKKAVDTIEGPLLVIAGPGTGKTQLLSLRVANILRRTDANPENILCLTYTESGQRAMQNRLIEIIGEPAKKVEVHTFHGFGTYLITKYPEYFPQLEDFRAADDLALYEVLADSFRTLDYDSPLAKRAYGQWIYLKDAAERISQCKQAGLTPEEFHRQVLTDKHWANTAGKQLAEQFQASGRLSAKQLPGLITGLSSLTSQAVEPQTLAEACLTSLQTALSESGKTSALSAWKRRWLASEDGELYFKPADQLAKLADFAVIYEAYEKGLSDQKLFDYDNMLLFALEALKNNDELRAVAQENFQYILADEYQDTNPAQATIIELIADNPVNEGRPNVMVVGDDDQAIYGFQGAMGAAMLAFRKRWRNVAVITLTENYRSTQGLLDTARLVITRSDQRLENYYQDINKQLRSNREGNSSPRRVVAPTPEAAVAHTVNLVKQHPASRQLAIIASKHRYLGELAARLDEAEITYFYEGRDDLLSDKEINRLLLMAAAALAIKQAQPLRLNYILPELITFDGIGLARSEGWRLAVEAQPKDRGWWQALQASSDTQSQGLAKLINALAGDIDPDNALLALRTISQQLPLTDAMSILDQKLEALVSHALSYSRRETLSLGELLAYISRCREAGIRLETKVEAGQRGAPVRLLTAHKSKGLEFDAVYVLHADEHTWFREKGRRNNLVLPPNWQYLQPATETFDDRLRLLYVVLTRAKQELLLLSSRLGRNRQATVALPGVEDISEEAADIGGITRPGATVYEHPWHAWYLPASPAEKQELQELLGNRLRQYLLSPSHLASFLNVPRGGPGRFFAHILLGIPEPVSAEAVYGSHIHACLGFMQTSLNSNDRLPKADELKTFVIETLDVADEKDADRLIKTVTRYQAATKALQKGSGAEYSFSDQKLKLGGIKVTGTVDRFDKTGLKLTLIDYKTGRPIKSWRAGDDYQRQKLHRFRQQLLFYELLFDLSPDFREIKSISSRLEFVEPDKRGRYLNLTLEADKAERDRLKALLAAVWRKIMDLDLPDTSFYRPDLKGILDLEDDLLQS